jgi:hypothetical protein
MSWSQTVGVTCRHRDPANDVSACFIIARGRTDVSQPRLRVRATERPRVAGRKYYLLENSTPGARQSVRQPEWLPWPESDRDGEGRLTQPAPDRLPARSQTGDVKDRPCLVWMPCSVGHSSSRYCRWGGGGVLPQSFSLSYASASSSNLRSWNGLPMNWRPTGIRSANPQGTVIAGRPVRFATTV